MHAWKARLADLIFGVQMIGAVVLCTSYFTRFLHSTQGASLAMFFCYEIFVAVNLVLVVRAHKKQPSRITHQALVVMITWLVGIALDIYGFFLNGSYHWGRLDTETMLFGTVSTLVVVAVTAIRQKPLVSPLILTWVAIAFKAFPQIFQAMKIFAEGNKGLAGLAIATGHVTATVRLTQLFMACLEAPNETNRRGAFIAELANELTWILVTIAWLVR